MDKEKIVKIVVKCLQVVIDNEGGLQTTNNADLCDKLELFRNRRNHRKIP